MGHRVKEDHQARLVCPGKENQVKMVYLDNQACRVRKVIQDHLVYQESQGHLALENQASKDQRVIKV